MGYMSRFAEEVSDRMGRNGVIDDDVIAEAERIGEEDGEEFAAILACVRPEACRTLEEFETAGHRPADVTRQQWVDIMRKHRRSLGQSEESGTRFAPYSDYEQYWEADVRSAVLSK